MKLKLSTVNEKYKNNNVFRHIFSNNFNMNIKNIIEKYFAINLH